jgi:predicted ATPase
LFGVLSSFFTTSVAAFDGDAMRALAAQTLALAQKQSAAVPLMMGHRQMAMSLMLTGDAAKSRAHFDRAMVLYDPGKHRALTARFGPDASVVTLLGRAWTMWFLGYPEAALRDAESALAAARGFGEAATLMYALGNSLIVHILSGEHATADARAQEQAIIAAEKDTPFWKAFAMMNQGCALALMGASGRAVELLSAGIAATRTTNWLPFNLLHLARAHAELGQFEDAWRRIYEASARAEKIKEKWCEAEVHRTAGDIGLMSPAPDTAKSEAHFKRALAVARSQKAKSWELRAAMSLARLWRDQGRRDAARNLLAPVYGWFTEGFDTLDLKEAKALLDALES